MAKKQHQPMNHQDFYDERGCCLTCTETRKEQTEGVQRDIWFTGKISQHYGCLCIEGKCRKCSWLEHGKCQRLKEEYAPEVF